MNRLITAAQKSHLKLEQHLLYLIRFLPYGQAQLYLIQQVTGDQPVLLLDDVMSELDIRRRMNLLSEIEGVQTFITCSDEGDLEAWQNYRTYEVFTQGGNGQVSVVKEGPDIQKQILREPVFE